MQIPLQLVATESTKKVFDPDLWLKGTKYFDLGTILFKIISVSKATLQTFHTIQIVLYERVYYIGIALETDYWSGDYLDQKDLALLKNNPLYMPIFPDEIGLTTALFRIPAKLFSDVVAIKVKDANKLPSKEWIELLN